MSRNAYSYEEFNLDAALNLSSHTERKSIKLAGVENIRSIYNNPSTSTEEFIIGAVEALGNANRNLMYANMSIEGFAQRFQVAARVAKNVNIARDRGLEGFENVHSMNPLAYSIEDGEKKGKFKEFVGRIWDALKTAARHIMTSIANFIKYIINKIREFALKKAIKDRKEFMEAWKNASPEKQKEIGDKKVKSMKWKDKPLKKLNEVITSIAKKYTDTFACENNDDYKALLKGTKTELKDIKDVASLRKLQKGFGLTPEKVREAVDKIENFRKEGLLVGIDGSKGKNDKGKLNGASKALSGVFYEGDKPEEKPISKIMDLTENFKCLDENWFKTSIVDAIASANKAQKGMTMYTKAIDAFVAKYKKLTKDSEDKEDANGEFKKWAMSIGRLSLKRMALNSYMQSILMEVEINAFRLTSTCHKAVRVGLKSLKGKGDKKKDDKSGESFYQPSVDELFSGL